MVYTSSGVWLSCQCAWFNIQVEKRLFKTIPEWEGGGDKSLKSAEVVADGEVPYASYKCQKRRWIGLNMVWRKTMKMRYIRRVGKARNCVLLQSRFFSRKSSSFSRGSHLLRLYVERTSKSSWQLWHSATQVPCCLRSCRSLLQAYLKSCIVSCFYSAF